MENTILLSIPFFGVLALLFIAIRARWFNSQDPGTEKMQRIAAAIAEGAMAFLKAEYKILSLFVICVTILLVISGMSGPEASPLIGVSFIVGAFCSALAGFIGMRVATKANVRTTNAARTSLGQALEIAFTVCSVKTGRGARSAQ